MLSHWGLNVERDYNSLLHVDQKFQSLDFMSILEASSCLLEEAITIGVRQESLTEVT